MFSLGSNLKKILYHRGAPLLQDSSNTISPDPDERWLAFEAFVREQFPALCAYAYRYVRSRDAAEEIVQDVLLRVWTRRNRIGETALVPYVYRSVAHAAVSRIRTERAIKVRNLRLEQQAADGEGSTSSAAAEELDEHVRRAIGELPERTRIVFLLSRDSGLTYAAIAARLGISAKTVENQIVRALRLLRASLRPHLLLLLISPLVTL